MTPGSDEFRRSLVAEAEPPGGGTLAAAMVVVIVLAAVLVVMLVWQNHASRAHVLTHARLMAFQESRILAQTVAEMTERADLSLSLMAEGARSQAGDGLDEASAMRLLRSIQPWVPGPATLVVHDATGRRVAVLGPGPSAINLSDRPFFQDHRSGATGHAVTPEGPPTRIRVSRRLEWADGAFAGVVSANFDPVAFDLGRDQAVTRQIDGAALVLPSGQVLAAWPRSVAARAPDRVVVTSLPLLADFPLPALAARGSGTFDLPAAIVGVSPVRNAAFLAVATIATERVLAERQTDSWLVIALVIALITALGVIGIGLHHDLAHKRAVMQRSHRVLARAVENSPAMTVIAAPDGTIEYVNRMFETITGFRRDEAVGAKSGDEVGNGALGTVLRPLWAAVRQREEWQGTVESRRKNGDPFFLSLAVSPIADAEGRVGSFVGVAEDVTERMETERHHRRIEKAEALGTLVAGVAHEFNNMLTPVLSMTGFVMRSLPADSREHGMLATAMRSAEKARDMVKRVRIFGHDNPDLWAIQDVSVLVSDCVAATASSLGECVTLTTDIPAGIGRVRADHAQVEAAIGNLIANAGQAVTPGEGMVGVTLSRADPDGAGQKLPPWLRRVPHAVIAVTDNGQGMAPDIQERIFDPFFTTREIGQGAGLGLAIVLGVATTHGGTLMVDSRVGAGTVVRLLLPLEPSPDG